MAEIGHGLLAFFTEGRSRQFVLRFGFEDRIAFKLSRCVKRALERGLLDEEIIDKKLTTHINGDDFRFLLQIRHLYGFSGVWFKETRRPLIRQFDAIVELFGLRAGGLVRQHEQLRVIRHDLAREHILLTKLRHQDLRVGVPIPIIENVDEPIRRLKAIGIRYRIAFIENEAALPRLAFIFGQPRTHVRALR